MSNILDRAFNESWHYLAGYQSDKFCLVDYKTGMGAMGQRRPGGQTEYRRYTEGPGPNIILEFQVPDLYRSSNKFRVIGPDQEGWVEGLGHGWFVPPGGAAVQRGRGFLEKGQRGEYKLVRPESGFWLWKKPAEYDFVHKSPICLPAYLDGDRVSDSGSEAQHANCFLLSGWDFRFRAAFFAYSMINREEIAGELADELRRDPSRMVAFFDRAFPEYRAGGGKRLEINSLEYVETAEDRDCVLAKGYPHSVMDAKLTMK